MIAYVLFNKDTPSERIADDLGERLKREQIDVEMLDADSPRGIQFVEDYDLLKRPAVALISSDGTPIQVWEGEDSMPTPADVAYFVHG
jgi:hypothetical protein